MLTEKKVINMIEADMARRNGGALRSRQVISTVQVMVKLFNKLESKINRVKPTANKQEVLCKD